MKALFLRFLKPALISGALIVIASTLLTPHLSLWGMLIATGVFIGWLYLVNGERFYSIFSIRKIPFYMIGWFLGTLLTITEFQPRIAGSVVPLGQAMANTIYGVSLFNLLLAVGLLFRGKRIETIVSTFSFSKNIYCSFCKEVVASSRSKLCPIKALFYL